MSDLNIELKQAQKDTPDFLYLVDFLTKDLAIRDGEDHGFYQQYNGLEDLEAVVIAYVDNKAVSCGAFKPYDEKTAEIKRMYTAESHRGKGIAAKVLTELETIAADKGYEKCVLETGIKQPEAIRLYEKMGYHLIPNYGPYVGIDNSRCFEKQL